MHSRTRIGVAIAVALFATAPAEAARRNPAPTQMYEAPVLQGAPAAAIGGAEFSLVSTAKSRAVTPIALPAPSQAELKAFHRARESRLAEGKALMIGFSRATPNRGGIALSGLDWQPLADGRLATRFQLSSAGAVSIRAELSLKASATDLRGTTIRYGGNDGRVFERSGADFIGKRSVWSPNMRGGVGTIEIVLPKGRTPDRFQLNVPRLNHMDVDPLSDIAREVPGRGGWSWPCHRDVVCRINPTQGFLNAQKSVAQMTYVANDGDSYVCTGTLLNNSRVPKRSLFWTAAHCISTNAEANTLQTIWFFKATTCQGTAVAPGAVELTGGARILHASIGRDTSLLELNEAPPFGAIYSGYNSARIASTGTAIEGIHHPAGDTMMYALGSVRSLSSSIDGKSPLYRVVWNTGITEGGSSGSALFTVSNGSYQLRGGLYGGGSTCSAPTASDYYSQLSGVWGSISGQF